MLLQKSLQKLLSTVPDCGNMRLWGKIRGTQSDYFIAEGTLAEAEPTEGLADPRGQGVNKYVYWACNSPLEKWTQLPDLRTQDLLNARGIKMNFTGDLDAKIYTNPFYFQSEKVYLRAQIARITCSTTLAAGSEYKIDEDSKEIVQDNGEEDNPKPKPTT